MPRLSVSRYWFGVTQPSRHTPINARKRPEQDDALVVLVRLLARRAAREVVGNGDAAPETESVGASYERQDGS